MDIREINDEYSVSGQIAVEDLDAIAARAKALGIETAHVPVGPMGVTAEAVSGMVDALDELPRPMLGYCRSGMRSTKTYEQTQHIRG